MFGLYNGSADGSLYGIGAISESGGVWTPDAGNPVLQVGAGGQWDDTTVKDPCLLRAGTLVCYYSGLDATVGGKYRIGRATATDVGGPWTKYGSNPVLDVGSGGAFDDEGVSFPVVLYEPSDTGREWKMWYAGFDGSVHRVGYAYSSDGLSWTKHGQVIDVGSGGAWNDEGVLPGGVIKDGSTYYLFVGGRQGTTNPRWQGGLYTFTDPEGTYTPDSNPIMLSRFNVAGSSQLLTAHTLIGSAVVTVGDTSDWHVGEPMAMADNDNATVHVSPIDSIDTGTQATLADAVTANMSTISGATIRPLAFNAILPRTVRRSGGGFEAWVTAFQPVQDLTVPGDNLREGIVRMTASDLAGPWTYDYATGLLVPIGSPNGSGWDSISAENLSVLSDPGLAAPVAEESGIPAGFAIIQGDPIIGFGVFPREVAGIPPGFLVVSAGPAQVQLQVPGRERPQMTEGGTEGQSLIYHLHRKPTWEDGGAGIPATTVTDETTLGIAPAVGTDTEYARQDHTHGSPSAATISAAGFVGALLISDAPSTPLVFADLIQNEAQDDLVYADT